MNRSEKRRRMHWSALYAAVLVLFSAYVLLDTFVIPRSYAIVQQDEVQTDTDANTDAQENDGENAVITDTSYESEGVSIKLTTSRYDDTTVYTADIVLSEGQTLETALANDTFGRNITQKTSEIAAANQAILAVNGDYYGAQNSGYVIRNGVLYRSTSSGSDQEDLVIYKDGTFEVIREGDVTAQELLDNGAWQVLSFGPQLVADGDISVSENDEVGRAMANNPRSAIGQIEEGHYVIVVADGRTSESTGLSLYQLAQFMQDLGVETAYNLDGGGSSTLYFNGSVVNNPTTNGRHISERSVSDIVYIGA